MNRTIRTIGDLPRVAGGSSALPRAKTGVESARASTAAAMARFETIVPPNVPDGTVHLEVRTSYLQEGETRGNPYSRKYPQGVATIAASRRGYRLRAGIGLPHDC